MVFVFGNGLAGAMLVDVALLEVLEVAPECLPVALRTDPFGVASHSVGCAPLDVPRLAVVAPAGEGIGDLVAAQLGHRFDVRVREDVELVRPDGV